MNTELKQKFTEIDDLLWEGFYNKQLGQSTNDMQRFYDAWKTVKADIKPKMKEIEDEIQKKLNYNDA